MGDIQLMYSYDFNIEVIGVFFVWEEKGLKILVSGCIQTEVNAK